MSHTDHLIEVIIPNWNGKSMLAHCLSSLLEQTYRNFSVTVVDNGSEDGSVCYIEEEFPEVKIIKLGHNTGFSLAVNRGIEQAESPYLFLLNNDVEVAPDCMEILRQSIEKYPGYEFFALKMLSFKKRDILDGAGDAVLRGGVGYRLGTLEKDNDYYRKDRETFGACAGAALYSKDFYRRVGVFDSDFFAYLEDVDLNMRARRLGLKCMYLGSAVVYHIGSATTGSKINKLTIEFSTRNNMSVLVKNYSAGMFFRFLPAILVYQLAWFLFCLKKSMLSAYFKGFFQALKSLPQSYRKRSVLSLKESNVSSKEFGNMIKNAEKEAVLSIMARRKALGKSNFLLDCYIRIFF